MAYFGKEFIVDRQENFEAFVKSLELPESLLAQFANYRPTTKLEKDGDSYKITTKTTDSTKVVTFKSGVEFDDEVRPGLIVKSKYVVDGDTITQHMTKDGKSIIFKREYSDDGFKVTITASFFDGVATRYYKTV